MFDKELAHLFCSPATTTRSSLLQRGSSLDSVHSAPPQHQQFIQQFKPVQPNNNNTKPSGYLSTGVSDAILKEMIDQNQRHIKEVNKDALSQFKKMITSELGSDNGTIPTVDDDEDDIDSMDTDSLLSARLELQFNLKSFKNVCFKNILFYL